MRRFLPHKLSFQALTVVVICALASSFILTANAGLRGPGKYCGVVVFDRWDTCFLLSGPYITYISDAVKNELRPYKGRAMQLDASEVIQQTNPGDALIRKYRIIGPAPEPRHSVILDGLELVAQSDFVPHGAPTFLIEIRNAGDKPVEVKSAEFGPTLLGLSPKGGFCASDGKSGAWITRGSLVSSSSWESGSGSGKYSASYTIDPASRPPQHFELAPGESKKVRVTCKILPGQYQFMVGYGGGVHEEKSLVSNAISFDWNDADVATLISGGVARNLPQEAPQAFAQAVIDVDGY
jgi:hypothetical protein